MDFERRADPRINQVIRIEIMPPQGEGDAMEAKTIDTSALGIGFLCPREFSTGQELSIAYIPEDSFTPITKQAIVRHVAPQDGAFRIGVEFF